MIYKYYHHMGSYPDGESRNIRNNVFGWISRKKTYLVAVSFYPSLKRIQLKSDFTGAIGVLRSKAMPSTALPLSPLRHDKPDCAKRNQT